MVGCHRLLIRRRRCLIGRFRRIGWLRRVVLRRDAKNVLQKSTLDRWSIALGRVVDLVEDSSRRRRSGDMMFRNNLPNFLWSMF
jgi:hypothetical protein